MAGAGLVKGSDVDSELQEVGLKLAVLANQLALNFQPHEKFVNKRSII